MQSDIATVAKGSMTSFDILFVADPRFSGGTSTALASEIAAAHKGGFRCGLLMVKGPLLRRAHPIHPELAAHIEAGRVVVVDPDEAVSAGLVLIHHPTLFQYLPPRRLRIAAGKVVLVVPHPEVDAAGVVQYDLSVVLANIRTVFGIAPVLAPVGVNVRRSLKPWTVGEHEITAEDWPHLIDLDQWPVRPGDRAVGDRIIVGRHSRPDRAEMAGHARRSDGDLSG